MRKLLKIAGLLTLLLLLALAGAGLYAWRASKSAPAFYDSAPLAGEDRLRAIESVERKVLNMQGDLDAAYANLRPQSPAAEVEPAGPVEVSFTGPELDTYFAKWLDDSGFAGSVARYMDSPRVGIEDGKIILAGKMRDFGAVVSLHFLPSLDESDGSARLRLERTYVGRLPVPMSYFDELRQKSVAALSQREPQLRADTDIAADATANDAAVTLTMQRQLLAMFEGREVSPLVIFPQIVGRGRVPAAVSRASVEGEVLTLGLDLMGREGRAALLESLKTPVAIQ